MRILQGLRRVWGRGRVAAEPADGLDCVLAVVGMDHDAACRRVFRRLRLDDQVLLERDRENAFDSNAVRVTTASGRMIGYVGRKEAEWVAPYLDGCGGLPATAELKRLDLDFGQVLCRLPRRVWLALANDGRTVHHFFQPCSVGEAAFRLYVSCGDNLVIMLRRLFGEQGWRTLQDGACRHVASNGVPYAHYFTFAAEPSAEAVDALLAWALDSVRDTDDPYALIDRKNDTIRGLETSLADAQANGDAMLAQAVRAEELEKHLAQARLDQEDYFRMVDQVEQLRQTLRDKQEELTRVGRSALLLPGKERPFYDGEIREALLAVLDENRRNMRPGSRLALLVDDLLAANPSTGERKRRMERVKAAMVGSRGMTAKLAHVLQEMGMTVEQGGKHWRVTYQGDPRFVSTMPCTASDGRSMTNNAMEMIHNFF